MPLSVNTVWLLWATRAVLAALEATLVFARSSLAQVVKTTVYIAGSMLIVTMNSMSRKPFVVSFRVRTRAGSDFSPAPFDIEIEGIKITPCGHLARLYIICPSGSPT